MLSGKKIEVFVAVALTIGALLALSVKLKGANEPGSSAIVVSKAWARPTLGNAAHGAAYLTIENRGRMPDVLVQVRPEVSRLAEIHRTTNEGGVMRMRRVSDGVTIPAGEAVVFAPTGIHIMLLDLNAPLKSGQSFPITLEFGTAGPVNTTVSVSMTAPPARDSK